MDTSNLKPNSLKYKESLKNNTPKQISKVTTGNVKVKKPGVGQLFAETFLSDNVETVSSYVVEDVIIPSVKDMIADLVKGAIDIILYGGESKSYRSSTRKPINYSSISTGKTTRSSQKENSKYVSRGSSISDIIFEDRRDAVEVVQNMYELMGDYHMVSKADLYDMVGKQSSWTDQKWGWYEDDIPSGELVRHTRDGWILDLPKPKVLD